MHLLFLIFFFSSAVFLFFTPSEDIQVSSHDRNRISPLLQEALFTSFFGLHKDMLLGSVNPMF